MRAGAPSSARRLRSSLRLPRRTRAPPAASRRPTPPPPASHRPRMAPCTPARGRGGDGGAVSLRPRVAGAAAEDAGEGREAPPTDEHGSLVERLSKALATDLAQVTPGELVVKQAKTEIRRYEARTADGSVVPLIRKQVDLNKGSYRDDHHRRMSQLSFLVEARAYQHTLPRLAEGALRPPPAVPRAFSLEHDGRTPTEASVQFDFLLEDLADSWRQHSVLGPGETAAVVRWLAGVHAFYWNSGVWDEDSLWELGGYWTLDKREEDLAKLEGEWDVTVDNWTAQAPELFSDGEVRRLGARLRASAHTLSRRLAEQWPEHNTLIHGDYKTANLFFSPEVSAVAVIDWQWCGKGLGVMDLTYLLCTSCSLEVLESHEEEMLRVYFDALVDNLQTLGKACDSYTWEVFNEQYKTATLDYVRFLVGSMWVKNTPESCLQFADSMNQGMHKRSHAHFIRLVRRADTLLAEQEHEASEACGGLL